MSNSVFLKPDENGNWGKVGTDAAGSMSEQLVFQSGATAIGNGTPADVSGYATLITSIIISATSTVVFEGSLDGTNYFSISSNSVSGTGTSQTQATASGYFRLAVSGLKFVRFRISVYGSGTVDVNGYASTAPFSPQYVTTAYGNSDSNAISSTLLGVGAYNLLFDGTNWVRQRVVNLGSTDGISISGGVTPAPLLGYNGTTWDRLRTVGAGDGIGTGLLAQGGYVWDSTGLVWNRARSANGVGDGTSGTTMGAQSLMAYNGASWDRVRVDSNTNVKVANTAQNKSTSVTIASAGTTSGAITLSGNNLVGLSIPSVWDGGNITIQGCDTVGGTYLDVYDSNGNIATVTVGGASRIVGLTGSIMQAVANIPFIRLVCGTAVGANRTIIVFSKG